MRVYLQSARALTLHADADELPEPSGTPTAGDTSEWRQGALGPGQVEIAIDVSDGGPVTVPKPVRLVGRTPGDDGVWRVLGLLNGGDDIECTEGTGYAQIVQSAGAYAYLQVWAGGNVVGGKVNVTATPLEVRW
jgi:hypothetical protein